jgi:hypothetical protein
MVAHDRLLETIGKTPRVEPILERARVFAVELSHENPRTGVERDASMP